MTPLYQWTHDGDAVLIVRQCAADGTSSHGFRYPLTVGATVEAPDWSPDPVCGGGLHGWPWGMRIGNGAQPDYFGTWLVLAAAPGSVVDLGGKVKCASGIVRYVGTWHGAMRLTHAGRVAWIAQASSAATSGEQSSAATSGNRSSAATSGEQSSAATSGELSSAATSGNRSSAATSGWQSSAATSGELSSAATSGEQSSAATSGLCSPAVCAGLNSRAKAGPYGVIALAWWNAQFNRAEMRCARVVDGRRGTLKPHVWYRLDTRGRFVEDE